MCISHDGFSVWQVRALYIDTHGIKLLCLVYRDPKHTVEMHLFEVQNPNTVKNRLLWHC